MTYCVKIMVQLHLNWRVIPLLQAKNTRHNSVCQVWRGISEQLFSYSTVQKRNLSVSHHFNMRRSSKCLLGSSSESRSSSEQDDYIFASQCSSPSRRPSTVDDEQSVKNLLKEIFALKETNVSSWLVENKVKNLCVAYNCLLKPHRDGFLKELACNYAVDHQCISTAAKSLVGVEVGEQDQRILIKCEERLKNLLTPQYSWLFSHMGRVERGVKFLVDLRTDVLILIGEITATNSSLVPLQQLNVALREMLSLWFTVGFLNLERVTWRSPCEMLQKISEYEAVHPMRSWTDLKRRVGLYRRCFVYTHSSMPNEPLVVLHTALSDEIACSMKGIVAAASRMSVDVPIGCPGLTVPTESEDPACVKAAIFYSITSTQKGLQGIELGNYLIKRVVKELQAEFPLVNRFSSLSPVPTFNLWLVDRLKYAEKCAPVNDLLTADEVEGLAAHLSCENVWVELRRLLKTNGWIQDTALVALMEAPLMRLCVRYLFLEKRRGYALDNVANFHLRNGAVMWRINWKADLSPRGLGNSCGIMVNYRYFLSATEDNSQTYLDKQLITASEDVRRMACEAAKLMEKLPSKI